MSVLSRSFALGVSGLAMVAVAGCAGGAGGSEEMAPPKEPDAALAGLDPCAVMKPDQLTSGGYETEGKPVKQLDFEPGCRYKGEKMLLTVYKNQHSKRSNWAEYSRFNVSGREAARALNAAGEG